MRIVAVGASQIGHLVILSPPYSRLIVAGDAGIRQRGLEEKWVI